MLFNKPSKGFPFGKNTSRNRAPTAMSFSDGKLLFFSPRKRRSTRRRDCSRGLGHPSQVYIYLKIGLFFGLIANGPIISDFKIDSSSHLRVLFGREDENPFWTLLSSVAKLQCSFCCANSAPLCTGKQNVTFNTKGIMVLSSFETGQSSRGALRGCWAGSTRTVCPKHKCVL